MRVLVTGGGGQVGSEVVAAFDQAGHTVVAATKEQLDVADRDSVVGAVESARPDTVVHCAAWTDVDGCELDPDRALLVNALGTRHVAEACALAAPGAHVVYLSTDYVFSGDLDRPYHEWDETGPLSAYGRSKLGGEHELLDAAVAHTIVRTSWVFGQNGHNMVKTALRLLGEDGPLRFVDDQRGCPTAADDLAGMIVRLAAERMAGAYHVTNQGATTWFEFVREVAAAAGHDPGRVEPVKTADLDPPRPAPRPANSVLDNAALRLSGVPLLDDFRVPLERLVRRLAS